MILLLITTNTQKVLIFGTIKYYLYYCPGSKLEIMKTYIIVYIKSGFFYRYEILAPNETKAKEIFFNKVGNYFIHSISTI